MLRSILRVDGLPLLAYSRAVKSDLERPTGMAHSGKDATMVPSRRTSCDGGGGAVGHPKTYLDMGMDTQVTCKYCGRLFVLDKNARPAAH